MDPLIVKTASLGFAALLIFAARHKLASRRDFRAVLADYRVLPAPVVAAASRVIPVAELCLGGAWLLTFGDVLPAILAASATASLLGAYTFGIVVNLLRGRRHLSCGCGLTAGGEGQHISPGLVLRNVLLVVVALAAGLPAPERALGFGGHLTLAAALAASALLYLAGSQLLRNASAIGSWRRPRD